MKISIGALLAVTLAWFVGCPATPVREDKFAPMYRMTADRVYANEASGVSYYNLVIWTKNAAEKGDPQAMEALLKAPRPGRHYGTVLANAVRSSALKQPDLFLTVLYELNETKRGRLKLGEVMHDLADSMYRKPEARTIREYLAAVEAYIPGNANERILTERLQAFLTELLLIAENDFIQRKKAGEFDQVLDPADRPDRSAPDRPVRDGDAGDNRLRSDF